MKKIILWLKESHRLQHVVGGLAIGLLSDSNYCATISGLVVASSLELKDKLWGGKWDWVDWALTIGGVIVGRLIRILV